MSKCIIFNLEKTEEYSFQYMGLILVKNIREYIGDIDIYCGIFTNRMPDDYVIKELKNYGVEIVVDKKFQIQDGGSNAHFLKNYTNKYFSSNHNLLNKYKTLINLDIDLLILGDLLTYINQYTKDVWVHELPEYIKNYEYIGLKNEELVRNRIFFNPVTLITNKNKSLWDLKYEGMMLEGKNSDIEFSKKLLSSGLSFCTPEVVTIIPERQLTDKTLIFHYDGFGIDGTFILLNKYDKFLYTKYKIYIENVLKIKINNDINYWPTIYKNTDKLIKIRDEDIEIDGLVNKIMNDK
jgi:hypothetical protein